MEDKNSIMLERILNIVEVLQADVSSLKEDVSFLKEDMKEVKGDIVVLKEDVSFLKDDMQEAKGDIKKLKKSESRTARDICSLREMQIKMLKRMDILEKNQTEMKFEIAEGFNRNAKTHDEFKKKIRKEQFECN